jgi:hypothetical protein
MFASTNQLDPDMPSNGLDLHPSHSVVSVHSIRSASRSTLYHFHLVSEHPFLSSSELCPSHTSIYPIALGAHDLVDNSQSDVDVAFLSGEGGGRRRYVIRAASFSTVFQSIRHATRSFWGHAWSNRLAIARPGVC